MHDIQAYQAEDGSEPYARWLAGLADRQARARVLVRVQRMPLDGGVWELRIDWGPGCRVYYAMAGRRVLLLVGGDKRRQRADIAAALGYWQDWQRRNAT